MATTNPTTSPRKPGTDKTRKLLLNAAKTIFSERGYDGTSLSDLVTMAGVNVSLVSYHFGGKEGLYRACLDEFGQERLAVAERLLKAPDNIEEFLVRLRMFVEELIQSYVKDPQLIKLVLREIDLGHPISKDIFQNRFHRVFEMLTSFFEKSQRKKILRTNADAQTSAQLFLGLIMHLLKFDPLSQKVHGVSLKETNYREKIINHIVNIFCNGLIGEK